MTTEASDTIQPVSGSGETIVAFSAEDLQAPFMLRVGALLIDYMALMIVPVLGLLSNKLFGDMNIATERTLWFLSVLLFLFNIVVLPAFTGRSFGKVLTGLRVVNRDGSIPKHRTIIFRQTVGLLLTALTFGFGFLLSIFGKSGRTLHDVVSGTVVVHGKRRVV